ncbi:hypothetical protein WKI68_38305 [Streptomyces sp. MS1.HAVA.3]|uniref:Uncharacterized protein n=1 Tax=Streptomyces caledonius TaxID=3134107 RepID=A0ABU8UCB5_9ACTN
MSTAAIEGEDVLTPSSAVDRETGRRPLLRRLFPSSGRRSSRRPEH